MPTLLESALKEKSHNGSSLKLMCVDVTVFKIIYNDILPNTRPTFTLSLPEEIA